MRSVSSTAAAGIVIVVSAATPAAAGIVIVVSAAAAAAAGVAIVVSVAASAATGIIIVVSAAVSTAAGIVIAVSVAVSAAAGIVMASAATSAAGAACAGIRTVRKSTERRKRGKLRHRRSGDSAVTGRAASAVYHKHVSFRIVLTKIGDFCFSAFPVYT